MREQTGPPEHPRADDASLDDWTYHGAWQSADVRYLVLSREMAARAAYEDHLRAIARALGRGKEN